MDRAATFTELTKRNALRKMAKLPLLDLRTEFALAVEWDAHRAYADQCERYDDDHKRITEDILTELRATRGRDFPSSVGGRLMVEMLSDQRFQAHLETEHTFEVAISRLVGSRYRSSCLRFPVRTVDDRMTAIVNGFPDVVPIIDF